MVAGLFDISKLSWGWVIIAVLFFAALRYLSLAGLSFFFFYRLLPGRFRRYKIQPRHPSSGQINHELFYSAITLVAFTFIGVLSYYLYTNGHTSIYTKVSDHSKGYLLLSFLLMIIIHDTYFYWTHRLLHTKWLFKKVHSVHHRSTNPTPLAAYAFHPAEALLEGAVVFPLITIFPVHIAVFFFFTFIVLAMNIVGHLGFELVPARVRNSRIGKIFTWSVHHNMHHQKARKNFGYYFTFWDHVMKTLHKPGKKLEKAPLKT